MTVDQRSDDDESPVRARADDALEPQVKALLGLLVGAAFVVILNETIMSVALPTLMDELAISATTGQWLTTVFMLTMAVVIPTTGLILQRFTTRAVFIAAMSLFTAGTAVSAAAPGFGVLLAGRVVQAAGTAVMIPLLMTVVLNFVPASRRGRTMGLITIVIAVAPAVGPTFSGLILSSLDWRWMFLLVLPVAVLSLVLGAALVKNLGTTRKVRFDPLSVLLSAVAFGGLIYGLSTIGGSVDGEPLVRPGWLIACGVVSLALFVWRQLGLQRRDAALLDLRPFLTRAFVVGIVVLLVAMGALFGTLILLPLYLQNVLRLTTLETGLVLLPGGLTMGLVAPIIGRLFDRVGARPLVIPGSFVVAAALASMTLLDESSSAGMVVAVHVLLSAGLGIVMTPLITSALGSLEASLYSHGSAIVNTLQQLAGAAGTALFITIMSTRAAAERASGSTPVSAQAAGIHEAFLWGAALSLVAVATTFLVRRPEPAES